MFKGNNRHRQTVNVFLFFKLFYCILDVYRGVVKYLFRVTVRERGRETDRQTDRQTEREREREREREERETERDRDREPLSHVFICLFLCLLRGMNEILSPFLLLFSFFLLSYLLKLARCC